MNFKFIGSKLYYGIASILGFLMLKHINSEYWQYAIPAIVIFSYLFTGFFLQKIRSLL